MKKKILSIMTLLLITTALLAQTISIQGVLRDPNGRTVDDGLYSVEFKLYDDATAGIEVWTETQITVPTQNGLFSTQLGKVNPLATVTFDKIYFLGLAIEGRAELTPRIELTISPYALAINGQDNKFPSVGDVVVKTNLRLEAGELIIENAGSGIRFPDNSILTTAVFGGSAADVSNNLTATITGDADEDAAGGIELVTGTQTRLMILNNGNVGIGEINPDFKLHLSDASAGPAVFLEGADADIAYSEGMDIGNWNGTDYTVAARFESDGTVAITQELTVGNNIAISGTPTATNHATTKQYVDAANAAQQAEINTLQTQLAAGTAPTIGSTYEGSTVFYVDADFIYVMSSNDYVQLTNSGVGFDTDLSGVYGTALGSGYSNALLLNAMDKVIFGSGLTTEEASHSGWYPPSIMEASLAAYVSNSPVTTTGIGLKNRVGSEISTYVMNSDGSLNSTSTSYDSRLRLIRRISRH